MTLKSLHRKTELQMSQWSVVLIKTKDNRSEQNNVFKVIAWGKEKNPQSINVYQMEICLDKEDVREYLHK